ncbi:hypothetical protein QJS04_geneDACA021300 [Acorus gramineus]|uniref:Uncharacterized protein n=1 Tax=Acorus gramineus TaxID=55184 RepID=A0AAV9AN09_ACOGR|nr:hypothetical protein QJS04_geneDACA021300 [Acorus gramineus]
MVHRGPTDAGGHTTGSPKLGLWPRWGGLWSDSTEPTLLPPQQTCGPCLLCF